jgi:hypothetical protein
MPVQEENYVALIPINPEEYIGMNTHVEPNPSVQLAHSSEL